MGLNGGPQFKFNEAVSFFVSCETQEEIDYYWRKLSENGEIQQCGWLKDAFGLSWQIVPAQLLEWLNSPDKAAANRTMQALLKMEKLDILALKAAYQTH